MLEINKKQEEDINKLKNKSTEIELKHEKENEKVDALELYGRRQNLEITAIPFKEGENRNNIVVEVAKLLDVQITTNQISTAHGFKSRPTNNKEKSISHPPIIVRFLSRDVRNILYISGSQSPARNSFSAGPQQIISILLFKEGLRVQK